MSTNQSQQETTHIQFENVGSITFFVHTAAWNDPSQQKDILESLLPQIDNLQINIIPREVRLHDVFSGLNRIRVLQDGQPGHKDTHISRIEVGYVSYGPTTVDNASMDIDRMPSFLNACAFLSRLFDGIPVYPKIFVADSRTYTAPEMILPPTEVSKTIPAVADLDNSIPF